MERPPLLGWTLEIWRGSVLNIIPTVEALGTLERVVSPSFLCNHRVYLALLSDHLEILPPRTLYAFRFGSWNNALHETGFIPPECWLTTLLRRTANNNSSTTSSCSPKNSVTFLPLRNLRAHRLSHTPTTTTRVVSTSSSESGGWLRDGSASYSSGLTGPLYFERILSPSLHCQ